MLKINLMNRGASEAISVLGTLTLFAFATMAFSSCSNLLAQAAQTARAEAVSPRMVLSAASGAVSAGANIDFGTVPVGSTCDITLTLENSGKSDLAIDVASIKVTTGNFSVKTNPPATITVGQPGTLILSLAPTSSGMKSATITIPTNDTKAPLFTFTVSGIGISIDLTTAVVGTITYISALGSATVNSDGGSTITARGICWSTSPNPTIANNKSTDAGGGTGSFNNLPLSPLNPGTFYYVRAWATNSDGTAYGLSNSFTTTAATSPTTTTISNINAKTAVSGGTVVSDPGVTISARGVCWSLSHNPTIADSKTIDAATSGYASSLTGLAVATTYYVRAYATNQGGTVYGSELSMKTVGYIGPGGGIVFYDQGEYSTYTTWRYLECQKAHSSSGYTWGPSTIICGTTTGLGAGKTNTARFVALGIGSYPAAQACVNDTSGGKTDWFLPSKDETQKIIDNMTEFYPLYITWTSSEWSGSPIDCLWKYNGVIGAYTKSGTGYVVPVRSY